MLTRRSKFLAVLLAFVLVLVSLPKVAVEAATPKLNVTECTLNVGETMQLTLKKATGKIKWSSSDKKIAKVSSEGLVTAQKSGTVTITAKNKSKQYTCSVTVVKPAILNSKNVSLKVGETFKLKLKNAEAASFASNNEKRATVSSKGVITAKAKGKVKITVTDTNNNKYTCTVTVTEPDPEPEPEPTPKPDEGDDNGDIDLGGMVLYIRDWWSEGTIENPVVADPETDYDKKQAAYRKEMMEKYNFTVYEVCEDDWGDASENFTTYVKSGGDDYNFVWTLHSDNTCFNALTHGYMADLSKIDCLDFTLDKFQRNKLHEKYSYGSSIYAAFPGFSEPRTGVYFNKNILREAGIDPDSIYDAQLNGTWDWNMFEEIMEKCQRDIDGDGEDDIYGLTLNEVVMIDIAVVSNGGSFFKMENGKLVSNVTAPETMEALRWCVDMFTKFDDHDPAGAEWDYFKQEWRTGKVAFMVEDEYNNVEGNEFYDLKDFEIGFVMFPKGPRASTYVRPVNDNAYVIPACYVGKDIDKYGHDKAWRVAFAWNLYTNPAPGEEYTNLYLDAAQKGNFDVRTLSETLPMMCQKEHGMLTYQDFIDGFYLNENLYIDMGPDLLWNLCPGCDVDAVVGDFSGRWKKTISKINKSL